MSYMYKIKEMLCKELKEYAEMEKLTASDLEMIHKLSDTIKNLDKIEMLEDEGGYSNHYPEYEDRGSSYARRGTHYVRGHYSRDDGERNYSEHYDKGYDRRYFMDKAKDHMMRKLGAMMEEADPKEREALKRQWEKSKGITMTADEIKQAEREYKEAMDIFPALHKY